MKKLLLSTLILIANFYTPAASMHEGDDHVHGLEISQPWARQTGNRTVSAAIYMNVANKGAFLDQLIDVTSDAAERVQVHQSLEQDGIMRMHHVSALPIAPNENLAFEPGGYHIMLTRLASPLKEGDIFPVTLTFEKAGDVTVHVLVTGIAGLQE
ncbi:copper chaperone PCu(A)C [Kordiimonas sp. SCSIO 12610]|uniref:copper chaperone PCu(A)C n=1 Tax=Kordiimonas sp. SCSIO 12610 TaxID=2829597 RepID=UPI00210BC6DC|nr:copper chaperone PCu(A)C [Kordiimonas sp. SCSIO 12610]UTW55169.1 copper chaperone PCu(A)C [Kordiimonas sp. SCSIO 12610]